MIQGFSPEKIKNETYNTKGKIGHDQFWLA